MVILKNRPGDLLVAILLAIVVACAAAFSSNARAAPVVLTCKFDKDAPRWLQGESVEITFDESAGSAQTFEPWQDTHPKMIKYPGRINSWEGMRQRSISHYAGREPLFTSARVQLCQDRKFDDDSAISNREFCYEIDRENGTFVYRHQWTSKDSNRVRLEFEAKGSCELAKERPRKF